MTHNLNCSDFNHQCKLSIQDTIFEKLLEIMSLSTSVHVFTWTSNIKIIRYFEAVFVMCWVNDFSTKLSFQADLNLCYNISGYIVLTVYLNALPFSLITNFSRKSGINRIILFLGNQFSNLDVLNLYCKFVPQSHPDRLLVNINICLRITCLCPVSHTCHYKSPSYITVKFIKQASEIIKDENLSFM